MSVLRNLLVVAFTGSLFFGGQAIAEICVQVDESKDALTPSERNAAAGLLENAFRKAGETVTSGDCAEKYTFANIRLGQSITSTITGPKGTRSLQITKIEELGAAFEQMAHSLVTGSVLGDSAGRSVGRDNVTLKQAVPTRIENDSLIYASVGPGFIVGADPDEVPISIAGGYRYELDSFAIDIGGQIVIAAGEDGGGGSLLGNVGGVYFLEPLANHSTFVGGSLGLSTIAVSDGEKDFAGGGLHARAAAGYEFFRASTMRFIIQADLTLPLYDLEQTEDEDGNNVGNDTKYAPVFGLSVGGGFSKQRRSITVRHL